MMDQQAMQRRMSASGTPQGGQRPDPQASPSGPGGPGGPAQVIQAVDGAMGQIGEAMGKIPGGEQLPKEMDQVRSGFRSVCEKAIQLSQGGGGGGPQPQAQGPQPMQPDRSQGMPASPAGMR